MVRRPSYCDRRLEIEDSLFERYYRGFQYESERWWGEALILSGINPSQVCKLMKLEVEFDMKQETCKYDWSCLKGTEWQHCVDYITNGSYWYYFRSGELKQARFCTNDPCQAKTHYLNACEVIERCKIDWWKSCERICKRLGVEVHRHNCAKFAMIRTECGSDNHGTLCVYEDFTFKLYTTPSTLTKVMMLAEVAKALIECGWKERC